ncbi:MAG: hypothetical protein ACRDWD_01320 [Acidimicrobiia bacterium]
MTDTKARDEAGGEDAGSVGEQIERVVNRIAGDLTVGTVFGAPAQVGDRLIITAASVQRAGGFGFGSGSGADPQGGGTGRGGGGGGGASTEGRPVAVIDVGPDGVRVQPILDLTRIGLTAVAAVLTVVRVGRRRRR